MSRPLETTSYQELLPIAALDCRILQEPLRPELQLLPQMDLFDVYHSMRNASTALGQMRRSMMGTAPTMHLFMLGHHGS